MYTIVRGGWVFTPGGTLKDHAVISRDGIILAVQPWGQELPGNARIIDARDSRVIPGLVDLHVHGALGRDVMDARPEVLSAVAQFLAQHGVTSFLPTTMASSVGAMGAALDAVGAAMRSTEGARVLGAHLEGPYLNPAARGAQPIEHLRIPDPREYGPWLAHSATRLMTLAPELPGVADLMGIGLGRGVRFSVGHSTASYDEVIRAADLGLNQASHVFNGMKSFHHREPGVLGAVLTDDRIYAQVILDGIHVHPAAFRLLLLAKTNRRVILISDAMRAAGMQDGQYDLGGQAITVHNGVPMTEAGGLAGSTLTLDLALRNCMQFAGLSLTEALPMASQAPAEALGMAGKIGSIQPGANADLVILGAELDVEITVVGGSMVYKAGSRRAKEESWRD